MPTGVSRLVTDGIGQVPLFHDSWESACQTAINALGGSKKVAALLWPSMNPDQAYTRLRHALQEDRPEKLGPGEVGMIRGLASAVGCHVLAQYEAQQANYEVRPIDPDEARKRAKRARRAWLLAELAKDNDDSE